MDILKIAGLAIVGAVSAMLFKQSKNEYSMILGLAMAFFISGYVVRNLLVVVRDVESLWSRLAGDANFLHILLRMVGITYISDLTAGICKECGYGVLAGQVATAGKMGVLLAGFPIFQNLLEFVLQLGA